jgi:hypothetical protein
VLLAAHPKVGKTTLLADLLRAKGHYCGREATLCRVLIASEEAGERWSQRHAERVFGPDIRVIPRPFLCKPSQPLWENWLDWLAEQADRRQTQVIIFDTISNLWPVVNENDAAQVNTALMPCFRLLQKSDRSLVIGHRLKKTDGQQGTGARGSSAFSAWVDVQMELRRVYPDVPQHPRRCLSVYGRWERTSGTVELTLDETNKSYRLAQKDEGVAAADALAPIEDVLRQAGRPLTGNEIYRAIPEGMGCRRSLFLSYLRQGAELGRWVVTPGAGRGHASRYSLPSQVPYSLALNRARELGTTPNPEGGSEVPGSWAALEQAGTKIDPEAYWREVMQGARAES